MPVEIAVAAPIWARTPDEETLLIDALRELSGRRLPMFLADGGSSPEFLARVGDLPGVTLFSRSPDPASRLLGQVRRAMEGAVAAGHTRVLYTEPDKKWFFTSRLDSLLEQVEAEPAGILLPARDDASFGTFPSGQQLTERMMNRLMAEALELRCDVLYGPLVIDAALVSHLDRMGQEIGWGWRIFLIAVAVRLGHRVTPWVERLPCPEEQRHEDDLRHRVYRMEQLAQNVKGLTLGLTCPLP